MNTDLLSGLLLTAVALVVVGYLVKEIFGPSFATFLAEHRAPPPAGVNSHLIGAVGRVVAHGQREGEMRVRVRGEGWSARLGSSDGDRLPVGAQVEVKAVVGHMLEVAEKSPA